MTATWYNLPGVSQRARWSESRRRYVFEDGTGVPREKLSSLPPRPDAVARATDSFGRPDIPGLRSAFSTFGLNTTATSQRPTRPPPPTLSSSPGQASSSRAIRAVTASDPTRNVQTRWHIYPSTQTLGGQTFTKKRIAAVDEHAEADTSSNEDSEEDGDKSGYTKSRQPRRDYVVGRVIELLLVPLPADHFSNVSAITPTRQFPGGTRLTGIRRYVIIRGVTDDSNEFIGLPIKTYNGQGVAAPGVVKSHHAVIYTRPPPSMKPAEQPRQLAGGSLEQPMRHQPILVEPYDRARPLDPLARLNFAEETPITANVGHMRLYGKVADSHLNVLRYQHQAVWASIWGPSGNVPPPPPRRPRPPLVPTPSSGHHGGTGRGSPTESTVTRSRRSSNADSSSKSQVSRPSQEAEQQRSLTLNEVQSMLARLRTRAIALRVEPPPDLTQAQMLTLALQPQQREHWLARLREVWHTQVQQQGRGPVARSEVSSRRGRLGESEEDVSDELQSDDDDAGLEDY